MKIEQKRTKCTTEKAIEYVADAYRTALGREPRAEGLAILVSQSALETGQWRSMYNWNAGNIRAGRSWKGLTQSIANADEIINGKRVLVPEGFRAFRTPAEGFLDFVSFLMVDTTPDNGRPNKWHVAADAVLRAGPGNDTEALRAYVFALADPDGNPTTSDGYFTADPNHYYDGGDGPGGRPGMLALYDQYLPLCREYLGPITDPAPPLPTSNEEVLGLFASTCETVGDLKKITEDRSNEILSLKQRLDSFLSEIKDQVDIATALHKKHEAAVLAQLGEHDARIRDNATGIHENRDRIEQIEHRLGMTGG